MAYYSPYLRQIKDRFSQAQGGLGSLNPYMSSGVSKPYTQNTGMNTQPQQNYEGQKAPNFNWDTGTPHPDGTRLPLPDGSYYIVGPDNVQSYMERIKDVHDSSARLANEKVAGQPDGTRLPLPDGSVYIVGPDNIQTYAERERDVRDSRERSAATQANLKPINEGQNQPNFSYNMGGSPFQPQQNYEGANRPSSMSPMQPIQQSYEGQNQPNFSWDMGMMQQPQQSVGMTQPNNNLFGTPPPPSYQNYQNKMSPMKSFEQQNKPQSQWSFGKI